jgi:preprotein translocase subunit SecA
LGQRPELGHFMLSWILKKIVGSKNQREIRRIMPLVAKINEIELSYQSLSDEQLQAKTGEFKARYAKGESLDKLLPEAFAVVKNACRRHCGKKVMVVGHELSWEMVPFDVQLVGGIVLHEGKISEMATGEGKTLVATMPLYLNALSGENVALVTVNDYLARRDSEWMGTIFKFLGLTVGCIQHDQPPSIRRAQYECDITYGTNSEFGFDYLRDNGMATRFEDQVQRGHFFAIVDEVDSILIDEARTPLIISGPSPVAGRHQFDRWKSTVSELARKQNILCNQLVQDAKKLLDSNGDQSRVGRLLFQVKQGQPKHKALMRLLETPSVRTLMDRAELDLLADTKREEMHHLKEEMYFTIDEKSRQVELSEKGRVFLEPNDPQAFVLPDLISVYHEVDSSTLSNEEKTERRQKVQEHFEETSERLHNIAQLLRAYCLYERDVEYVVQDGKVMIVDEFTGRLMPGRRWSDGLHQAVEAKEGVEIEQETQTLATITIQNYFRLYKKLAGMTGTAETEATEFFDIYKLSVNVIPTNRDVQRKDYNDVIYKTRREKYNRIVREIQERHAKGQPVLVGTISVETSELLSRMLKRAGIVHSVLNAKYHQQEAEIVSRAGQRGAVTIATNMAGRGTDIKLGEGVSTVGGLHVIGTERHESRRIDRQLRGRCARQGDPGSSQFFISLEDDLMRLFASGKIGQLMGKLGFDEGQELEHSLLNRSVESAQKRVEQHHYQIRKHTLEYDDVMNKQREIIYGLRNEALKGEGVHERIQEVLEEVIQSKVDLYLPKGKAMENWDVDALVNWANITFPIALRLEDATKSLIDPKINPAEFLLKRVREVYEQKQKSEEPEDLARIEKTIVLSAIDRLWQEHLYNMDGLRTGISLRQYGQRDPLIEYKQEAFKLFTELMANIQEEIASNLFRSATSLEAFEKFLGSLPQKLTFAESPASFGDIAQRAAAGDGQSPEVAADAVDQAIKKAAPVRRDMPKVGRNEPCPCGSGKKFKSCHGAIA